MRKQNKALERSTYIFMDFSGRIILSYIEEDNTQRAYFRVRPLLTEEGVVSQSDIDALPDDGYLRVVPDKNEQHTFKERMRELGALCVLDLLNLPPDVVKIRSNKNYAPARGESNQFIVYSDAVQAVPQQLFFEVISAENSEKEKIARAGTPLCYLRSGGRIYGPVSRATALEQEGAAPLAPDSEGLFSVTLPDGGERLFYWPRRALKAAAPALEKGEDAPEAAEERKLSGMPLYQTVARRPVVQQRAHNPLVDAVGQQMNASRVEAPGAVLSAGAAARQVENPMDAFKRALGALWPMPDMQRQAVAHFLSLTGVQNILNKQLAGAGTDAVAAAMNSQIQDLEAERLALLMQLDTAKKDLAGLRREALEQAAKDEKEKLSRVQQEVEQARLDLEKLNTARGELLAERDAALADLDKADAKTLRLRAPMGGYADVNTLCERVQKALAAAGVACARNDALHLLAVLCLCGGQMELHAPTLADSLSAARALAQALGTQAAEDLDDAEAVRVEAGGDGFRLLIDLVGGGRLGDYTRLIVDMFGRDDEPLNGSSYALRPWPVVYLKAAQGWQFADAPAYPPVRADCVRESVLRECTTPSTATLELIDRFDRALCAARAPLPHAVKRQMYAYLSAMAGKMDGGVASALDYAASTWIVPHVRRHGVDAQTVRELAQGLPQTLALLER